MNEKIKNISKILLPIVVFLSIIFFAIDYFNISQHYTSFISDREEFCREHASKYYFEKYINYQDFEKEVNQDFNRLYYQTNILWLSEEEKEQEKNDIFTLYSLYRINNYYYNGIISYDILINSCKLQNKTNTEEIYYFNFEKLSKLVKGANFQYYSSIDEWINPFFKGFFNYTLDELLSWNVSDVITMNYQEISRMNFKEGNIYYFPNDLILKNSLWTVNLETNSFVLVVDGNVYIDSNIIWDINTSYLLITRGDIFIDSNVEYTNWLFVSSGKINTWKSNKTLVNYWSFAAKDFNFERYSWRWKISENLKWNSVPQNIDNFIKNFYK